MKKVTIYTDGSCLDNPGIGAWAYIIIDEDGKINKEVKAYAQTTNNIMELSACIYAIKSLKQACDIKIFSDSKYVVDGVNKWLQNWIKSDFKGKKNVQLWKEYLECSKNHKISISWVKAHNGDEYNELCDKLANDCAKELANKLNKDNISVKEDRIYAEIEEKLGYSFKNQNLLQRALTHKSFNKDNNERLEFLGDAVLDLVVANTLYVDFLHYSEGDLSKLRAALVNEKSLAKIAQYLNLGKYLNLSNSEVNNGGRQKPSLLSNAFEAILGAIYLESGYEKAQNIAEKIINKIYPNIDIDIIKDYKTKLQEITQAKLAKTPEYKVLSSNGPDHKKEFTIGLFLNDELIAQAVGKSKKEAEQIAAKITLKKFEDE